MPFEPVHTMTAYYDGPREGIADFEGQPHLYESEWNDLDGEAETFLLSPVSPEVFTLALESWAIWRRWEIAFHGGLTTQETHPALPEDRPRREELERLLKSRLVLDPAQSIRARAHFRAVQAPSPPGAWPPLEVRWERMETLPAP